METLTRLARTEVYLLPALLFVLPTAETPKNLLIAVYVLVWVGRRLTARTTSWRSPDRVEWALLLMLAASFASTLFNLPYPTGFKGFVDSLKFIAMFWCVYRGGYSDTQHRYFAYSIALGVLIGLVYGTVEVVQKLRPALEFHSAGVVTQSSIYLGISLIMTTGLLLTNPRGSEKRAAVPIFWGVCAIIMTLGLFYMASRGSIVAVVITVAGMLLALKKTKLLAVTALVVAIAIAIMLATPNIFDQHRAYTKLENIVAAKHLDINDVIRFDNWRIAIKQTAEGGTLWFGVGPMNFSNIDRTRFDFDPPLSIPPDIGHAHAHNMFLTKFAEEGAFGFAAFMFFYLLMVVALIRDWRAGRFLRWQTVGAFGALAVPSIAGSFNAPFYQEHAILAMTLLAIYMSSKININRLEQAKNDVRTRGIP
jgi:O-antigen ligase